VPYEVTNALVPCAFPDSTLRTFAINGVVCMSSRRRRLSVISGRYATTVVKLGDEGWDVGGVSGRGNATPGEVLFSVP